MPETAENQPRRDEPPSAPKVESFLGEKDEFCLLLKSIEENAKHAQTITFTLLGSCAYILLAVFITRAPDANIKLPIINQDVPIGLFFAVSPLVILIAYTYLHIYLRELRGRLEAADVFVQGRKLAAVKADYLFFPWIVVFAHHYRNKASHPSPESQASGIGQAGVPPRRREYLERQLPGVLRTPEVRDLAVRVLTSFVLWFLGPVVLFVLWAQFVGERDAVSIIPCLCLVVSIVVARAFAVIPLKPVMRIFLLILSILLVVFTVSSVPALGSALGLDAFYTTVRDAWQALKSLGIAWWGWILIGFLGLQLLPMAIWLVLRPFGVYTLRWRLSLRLESWVDRPEWVTKAAILPGFLSFLFFLSISSRRLWGFPRKVDAALLRGCCLDELCLRGVSFSGADLSDARFNYADLREADLSMARLVNARFSFAHLEGAILRGAQASSASFVKASLAGADLRDADLHGAYLVYANLSNADLRGADLCGANLTGADLTGAFLDGARYSDSTKFPEGFQIPSNMIRYDQS